MAEAFLGEIRLMSFNYAPKGWALCNGQMLPINQNQALFSLLGTMYGGNGQTTFALPDLRGVVPLHTSGSDQGQRGGEYAHRLTLQEMPAHVHTPPRVSTTSATDTGNADPTNRVPGPGASLYHDPASLTPMRSETIVSAGGSQLHDNSQPYSVVSFCMALTGIFPSRN